MSNDVNFKIGDEAVKTIIELRDQEPGDKEYALFLQIDGVQGNQFTYDLSFLDRSVLGVLVIFAPQAKSN